LKQKQKITSEETNDGNNTINTQLADRSSEDGLSPSEPDPGEMIQSHGTGAAGVKLFVGQVPKGINEGRLRSLFEKYGVVTDIMVLRDRITGVHKGCAFVTFQNAEDADRATEELHDNHVLPEGAHPLQIRPAEPGASQPENKLFVGMIPRNVTENDLRELFSKYGEVDEITILRGQDGNSKGCAFLRFQNRLQSQNAIENLNSKWRMEGSSHDLVVRFADTERQKKLRKIQQQHLQIQQVHYVNVKHPQMTNYLYANPMQMMNHVPGLNPLSPVYQGPPANTLNSMSPMPINPSMPPNLSPNIPNLPSMPTIQNIPNMANLPPNMSNMNMPPIMSNMTNMPPTMSNIPNMANLPPNMPNMTNMANMPPNMAPPLTMQNTLPHPYSPYPLAQFPSPNYYYPIDSPQREGPEGSNLFVYHLPNYFTDTDLFALFTQYGNVLSAKVYIDKATKQSKCFGFVSFDNPNSAAHAISQTNGYHISGKRLKVQVKNKKEN